MLTAHISAVSNSQLLLLKKMWVAFANAKPTHIFFSKNISVYAIFNDQSFNDILTNDIVSFEQLDPGKQRLSERCLKGSNYVVDLIPYHTCTKIEQVHFIIGIKHDFSCINIRQVPWKVLKTAAQGTWRMLMHWKTMFDRYYCIKTENIWYISRYFLHNFVSPFHRCLANVISTDYARFGAGQ